MIAAAESIGNYTGCIAQTALDVGVQHGNTLGLVAKLRRIAIACIDGQPDNKVCILAPVVAAIGITIVESNITGQGWLQDRLTFFGSVVYPPTLNGYKVQEGYEAASCFGDTESHIEVEVEPGEKPAIPVSNGQQLIARFNTATYGEPLDLSFHRSPVHTNAPSAVDVTFKALRTLVCASRSSESDHIVPARATLAVRGNIVRLREEIDGLVLFERDPHIADVIQGAHHNPQDYISLPWCRIREREVALTLADIAAYGCDY